MRSWFIDVEVAFPPPQLHQETSKAWCSLLVDSWGSAEGHRKRCPFGCEVEGNGDRL